MNQIVAHQPKLPVNAFIQPTTFFLKEKRSSCWSEEHSQTAGLWLQQPAQLPQWRGCPGSTGTWSGSAPSSSPLRARFSSAVPASTWLAQAFLEGLTVECVHALCAGLSSCICPCHCLSALHCASCFLSTCLYLLHGTYITWLTHFSIISLKRSTGWAAQASSRRQALCHGISYHGTLGCILGWPVKYQLGLSSQVYAGVVLGIVGYVWLGFPTELFVWISPR